MRADPVEIGTSVRETDQAHTVCILLAHTWPRHKEQRFPVALTVNHERVDLIVDGDRRSFDAYLFRREARMHGVVGGKEITVSCAAGLRKKLELKSLGEGELLEFFPAERPSQPKPVRRSPRPVSARARREPTPKQALESLGVVYAPKRSRPFPAWALAGFERNGDQVSASYLQALVGKHKYRVVVMTHRGPSNRAPVLNLLIHRVNTEARLEFPLDLTVHREPVEIPVDGRPTRFTTYICGEQAAAEAPHGGGTITIDGPLKALRELQLVSLGEEQVTKMMRARKEWTRRVTEEFRSKSR